MVLSRSLTQAFASAQRALRPTVHSIWRRRNIVLYTLVSFIVIGSLYLLIASRTYKSTAEVYTDPGLGGGEDYQIRQCQLITSTPVLAIALTQDGITGLETL